MKEKEIQEFLTDEQVKEELNKKAAEAEKLLNDESKLEAVLQRIERKLDKIPKVGEYLSIVPTLISLVRAYIKREYTAIPLGSMIAIVGSLLYFLSPVDLIPDVIPGVGHIDDGLVIAGAVKLVKDDLKEYKIWRANKTREDRHSN